MVDGQTDKCIKQTVLDANCKRKSLFRCELCKNDFFLYFGERRCESDTNIKTLEPKYSTLTITAITDCVSQREPNKCEQCSDTTYLSQDKTSCKPIAITGCVIYSADPRKCAACVQDKMPSETQEACVDFPADVPKIPNCLNHGVMPGSDGKPIVACRACLEGFVLYTPHICRPLVPADTLEGTDRFTVK